jgi:hypothetical protein
MSNFLKAVALQKNMLTLKIWFKNKSKIIFKKANKQGQKATFLKTLIRAAQISVLEFKVNLASHLTR